MERLFFPLQLLLDFHQHHTPENTPAMPQPPQIALLSVVTPKSRHTGPLSTPSPTPFPNKSALKSAIRTVPRFSLFLFLFTTVFFPAPTMGYGYNSANQRVIYYPSSLMISHHSKPVLFYSDATIVNIRAALGAAAYGPDLTITNNCSDPQRQFLNKVIESTRSIQRVVKRLISIQGATNLIECDWYLRLFYRYSTGLTPTMTCPRGYRTSRNANHRLSPTVRVFYMTNCMTWLKGRSRRSSWL